MRRQRETHGGTNDLLYNVWKNMRMRCQTPGRKDAHLYHDKGIRVCQEWDTSYTEFRKWAIENGYEAGLFIDRRDGNLGYCPENCRFVTILESTRNTTNTSYATAFEETKRLCEWAEDPRCVVSYNTLEARIRFCEWDPEAAITTPAGTRRKSNVFATAFNETKPLKDWSKDPRCRVSYTTLYNRVAVAKWTDHELAITKPAK